MGWISTFCCESSCINLLLAGIVCITATYLIRGRRKKNFPPGPRGLPLVGYAPFLGSHASETLRKLKGEYGSVMSLRLGMEDWIILNDFSAINEGLLKQGEKFSGRPKNQILDLMSGGMGIVFADYGNTWKQLRKFGLMTLRDFGVGKKSMEQNIIEETPYLLEELITCNKYPREDITNSVTNIICRVIFGRRFEYDDNRISELIRIMRELTSDNMDSKLFAVTAAAPILRHLPVFRGAIQRVLNEVDKISSIIKDIVDEHQNTFDERDIRDFIDAFFVESHQRGEDDSCFNVMQLCQYIRDLFTAGSGTTSSTLTWALLALVNYPECQEKIADEIEKTIGDSGLPSMKHQTEMNYTCAFIHELMRHRTLVPTGILHQTSESAVLQGYTIPKNTPVIANIWAVHHDPQIFESPSDFKPERFLNNDGKFVKSSHFIPFSVGPRHCLGEQLARMELFIFLTGIVQKLKIVPDSTHPPPPLTDGIVAFMATYEPPEFRVNFKRR